MRTTVKLPSFQTLPQITPRFVKPNSIVDMTFDDMDIIAEPPWMALRRVTEAMEFGVSTTEQKSFIFVISPSFLPI